MKKRPRKNILKILRNVVDLEARALLNVRRTLDGSYTRAVRLIARCRGKVIVTGIGKSGIIAQKIAATLASTGTPAIYLHPAEGMHGDLGVVEPKDLILAIGKSGESQELNVLLPPLRQLGVHLIAITANARSTLARNAQVTLATPIEREACPLNLAPTCSTTAALAVGDALAVALMELRRFRKEHFARLHPGGQLGRRLTLRVEDVMRKGEDNPVVPVKASTSEMLLEITRKHAGAVSVVDKRGRLAGFITDYDIRRVIQAGEDLLGKTLAQIMNPKPLTIRTGKLAVEAVDLMTDRRKPFNILPVVDARGRSAGLIHIQDLRALGL